MSVPQHNYQGEFPRPPYMTSNSSHDSPTAPSTLSPSTPSSALPGVAMLAGGPPLMSRQDNTTGRLPYASQPIHIPPINELQPRYVPDYDPAHQEQLRMHGAINTTPGLAAIGPPVAGQKRAYRQRRKDPSCDACRERKVKCDATETSSCSECSSRSVKCQFTKETNRRMSSIKQVQDLERQLQEARQKVSQLQSRRQTDIDPMSISESTANSRPLKKRRVGNLQNAAKVSKNLRIYGKGIFRTDFNVDHQVSLAMPEFSLELPQQSLVKEVLAQFDASSHNILPFVDVEYYLRHLEDIYRQSKDAKTDKIAVLLGLFAFEGISRHSVEADEALRTALTLLSVVVPTPSLDMVRAMTFTSLALVEGNQLSLAYRIMGQAVRAAQELGINRRLGIDNREETQKCAMWCGLYSVEPLIAVQLGLPTMFADEDHDALLGWATECLTDHHYSRLQTVLGIARVVVDLGKTMSSSSLDDIESSSVDAQLDNWNLAFPLSLQPSSKEFPEIANLSVAVRVQDLRLILHRQQLIPTNPYNVRAKALEDCMRIVSSTADLLARTKQALVSDDTGMSKTRDEDSSWTKIISSLSATYFCMHIWRSFLFLAAYGQYDGAILCAEVGVEIGSSRSINEYCGRYAEFFLRWSIEDRQNPTAALIEDEELLVYLSGDLQGNIDQAWVWEEDSQIESSTSQLAIKDEGDDKLQTCAWHRVVEKLQNLIKENVKSLKAIVPPAKFEPSSNAGQQTSPTTRIAIADIM